MYKRTNELNEIHLNKSCKNIIYVCIIICLMIFYIIPNIILYFLPDNIININFIRSLNIESWILILIAYLLLCMLVLNYIFNRIILFLCCVISFTLISIFSQKINILWSNTNYQSYNHMLFIFIFLQSLAQILLLFIGYLPKERGKYYILYHIIFNMYIIFMISSTFLIELILENKLFNIRCVTYPIFGYWMFILIFIQFILYLIILILKCLNKKQMQKADYVGTRMRWNIKLVSYFIIMFFTLTFINTFLQCIRINNKFNINHI